MAEDLSRLGQRDRRPVISARFRATARQHLEYGGRVGQQAQRLGPTLVERRPAFLDVLSVLVLEDPGDPVDLGVQLDRVGGLELGPESSGAVPAGPVDVDKARLLLLGPPLVLGRGVAGQHERVEQREQPTGRQRPGDLAQPGVDLGGLGRADLTGGLGDLARYPRLQRQVDRGQLPEPGQSVP
jgi:hypothetical protein